MGKHVFEAHLTCPTCGGRGFVAHGEGTINPLLGFFLLLWGRGTKQYSIRACPRCKGDRYIYVSSDDRTHKAVWFNHQYKDCYTKEYVTVEDGLKYEPRPSAPAFKDATDFPGGDDWEEEEEVKYQKYQEELLEHTEGVEHFTAYPTASEWFTYWGNPLTDEGEMDEFFVAGLNSPWEDLLEEQGELDDS